MDQRPFKLADALDFVGEADKIQFSRVIAGELGFRWLEQIAHWHSEIKKVPLEEPQLAVFHSILA